jgi:hypothetical protein
MELSGPLLHFLLRIYSTMNECQLHARFVEAFSLILISELGDKTFFVAGLFAMKTNK